MNNNNRKENVNSNYIYPQPYIDPMVYLNPYYSSNMQGYQYNNNQGYIDYSQFNNGYIDYSQFNENQNNTTPEQNYVKNQNEEYTNIPPEEDFNIPYIPYYPPSNMSSNTQNIPNMILPNTQYQGLPPNMGNQGFTNQNQQNPNPQGIPNQNFQNMNIPYNQMSYIHQPMPYIGYVPMTKPMYPANMFPNMYPEVFPNMMYPNYPFVNMGPDMSNINMEEFDEEEM